MRFDTSNLFLFGTNICALQNRTAKKKETETEREREREREKERERGGGGGGGGGGKKGRKIAGDFSGSIDPLGAVRKSRPSARATARVWPRKLHRPSRAGV